MNGIDLSEFCSHAFNSSFHEVSRGLIGTEIELCLVDSRCPKSSPPDKDMLKNFLKSLGKFYSPETDAITGEITSLSDSQGCRIGPDFSRCTFEVSTPPFQTLTELEACLCRHLDILTGEARSWGLSLLGAGFHPFEKPSAELIYFENSRYSNRRLDFLQSTCQAIHVSISVSRNDAVRLYTLFRKCAPIMLIFFSNSRYFLGGDSGTNCIREKMWDASILDSRRVGVGPALNKVDDYYRYLADRHIDRAVSGGRIIHLDDGRSFGEYVKNAFTDRMAMADGRCDIRDTLAIHESTVWFNTRLRYSNSVLEIRAFDSLPRMFAIVPSVLIRGILQNIEEAESLVSKIREKDLAEGRRNAIYEGMNSRYGGIQFSEWCAGLIEVSSRGIRRSCPGGDGEYCGLLERFEKWIGSGTVSVEEWLADIVY